MNTPKATAVPASTIIVDTNALLNETYEQENSSSSHISRNKRSDKTFIYFHHKHMRLRKRTRHVPLTLLSVKIKEGLLLVKCHR
jgi:hypothetical protein